jgi:hypothetical protein
MNVHGTSLHQHSWSDLTFSFTLTSNIIASCSFCYSVACVCLAVACLTTSCSTIAYVIAAILEANSSILTHANDYTYICNLTVQAKTFVVA